MGTKMDVISVGDFIFYDKTFVSKCSGVGLVIKKVCVGNIRVVSKRELSGLIEDKTLPSQVLKAHGTFEPIRARVNTVIIMIAMETEKKVIYRLIAKSVQHTHPHEKASPIMYNKIDKEASLRNAKLKNEKMLHDIKTTRAQKAATAKRLKAVKEKGGEAWNDMKERVTLQQKELAEERRLQRLIKRSRETIYGK